MQRKARDLIRGDVFRLHVYGDVLAAIPVAGGKRVKVTIALENQGQRWNCGALTGSDRPYPLEFLDAGHVLEFICSPGRNFHLCEWNDDDTNDDEVVDPPPPEPELVNE